MTLVGIVVAKGCSKRQACRDLEVPRANFHRRTKPIYQGPPLRRKPPVNKVPDALRQRILDCMHEEEFVDSSPWEIVPRLLDKGEYLGSIRTFYRVLSENGEVVLPVSDAGPLQSLCGGLDGGGT